MILLWTNELALLNAAVSGSVAVVTMHDMQIGLEKQCMYVCMYVIVLM